MLILFAQEHAVQARGRGGRSGRSSDITFSGEAILKTENGDVTYVDASECPGGCAVDGRCQDGVPESTAKMACEGHRLTQAIGSLICLLLSTVGYGVFVKQFIYPVLCKRKGKKSNDKYEEASHVNQDGTPIGEWPMINPSNFMDPAPVKMNKI